MILSKTEQKEDCDTTGDGLHAKVNSVIQATVQENCHVDGGRGVRHVMRKFRDPSRWMQNV